MIENDKIAEWIDRYNRNDLRGKELEEFMELLKQDPELRKEVKLDKELNDLFREKDEIDLRRKLMKHRIPNRENGINYPLILLAASVIILITLTIFFYFMIRIEDEPALREREYTYYPADTSLFRERGQGESLHGDVILPTDDQKIVEKLERELLSMREDFEIYPPYESLVAEVYRSEEFRLITPRSPAVFEKGEIIDFTWKPAANQVNVIILNNRGKEIHRSEQVITGKLSFKTEKLSPGLYYVKFIGREEIVFFSKFTLK
jgi:hypothetical protein